MFICMEIMLIVNTSTEKSYNLVKIHIDAIYLLILLSLKKVKNINY